MRLLDSSTMTDSREVDKEIEDLQETLLAEWQDQRDIERAETGADREEDEDEDEDEPDMDDTVVLLSLKLPPSTASDKGNLIKLLEFREEAQQYCAWDSGETLIEANHFKDYAEELANDIGAVDRNAGWPCNHIDWEAAADALKEDYVSISFGDEEWYVLNS